MYLDMPPGIFNCLWICCFIYYMSLDLCNSRNIWVFYLNNPVFAVFWGICFSHKVFDYEVQSCSFHVDWKIIQHRNNDMSRYRYQIPLHRKSSKLKRCDGTAKHHVFERDIPPPLPARVVRLAPASCCIRSCVALATGRGSPGRSPGCVQLAMCRTGGWTGVSEMAAGYLRTSFHFLGQHLISDLVLQADKPTRSTLDCTHVGKSLTKYIPLESFSRSCFSVALHIYGGTRLFWGCWRLLQQNNYLVKKHNSCIGWMFIWVDPPWLRQPRTARTSSPQHKPGELSALAIKRNSEGLVCCLLHISVDGVLYKHFPKIGCCLMWVV